MHTTEATAARKRLEIEVSEENAPRAGGALCWGQRTAAPAIWPQTASGLLRFLCIDSCPSGLSGAVCCWRDAVMSQVAATEDEEAARRRAETAESLQKRTEDVKDMLTTFYCKVGGQDPVCIAWWLALAMASLGAVCGTEGRRDAESAYPARASAQAARNPAFGPCTAPQMHASLLTGPPAGWAPGSRRLRGRLQICDKQYVNARQLEEHLASYDHHHRKRDAEMRVRGAGSSWLGAWAARLCIWAACAAGSSWLGALAREWSARCQPWAEACGCAWRGGDWWAGEGAVRARSRGALAYPRGWHALRRTYFYFYFYFYF